MPAIKQLPEASVLRVRGNSGQRDISTLIPNRRHSNVAFILGESMRFQPEKDTLSVVPGVATSYPNVIFDVGANELKDFVSTLESPQLKSIVNYRKQVVEHWGLRRSNPRFWSVFHDINQWMREDSTVTAGIPDLNRYQGYPF